MSEPVDYHDTCHHKTFFLSCNALDELLAYAGRRCQICELPESEAKRGRLVIDHLRDYGWHLVRGLLCDKCNALMRRIDSGERRASRAVIDYQQNAWFARMLHPKGPSVRVMQPTLLPSGKYARRVR